MEIAVMTPRLRVGIVDDHAVVRAGYRRLIELETGVQVCTEYATAEAANAALSGSGPCPLDVLVLDLSLPGQGGFDLLRRLTMRRPGLRVLVFSMHSSPVTVRQCLDAGAAGFVTKCSPPEVLVASLGKVAAGEVALSPDVAAVAQAAVAQAAAAPHEDLSMREFDILRRLAGGHAVERIAEEVHLSAKTVANYQTEIRRKLGVTNAIDLLNYTRRHGIAPA